VGKNMTHPEINLLWASHVIKAFGRGKTRIFSFLIGEIRVDLRPNLVWGSSRDLRFFGNDQ